MSFFKRLFGRQDPEPVKAEPTANLQPQPIHVGRPPSTLRAVSRLRNLYAAFPDGEMPEAYRAEVRRRQGQVMAAGLTVPKDVEAADQLVRKVKYGN